MNQRTWRCDCGKKGIGAKQLQKHTSYYTTEVDLEEKFAKFSKKLEKYQIEREEIINKTINIIQDHNRQ